MSRDATSKMAPRVSRTRSRTQRLVATQLGSRGVPHESGFAGRRTWTFHALVLVFLLTAVPTAVRVGKLLVSKRFLIAPVEKLIVLAATSFLLFFFFFS